MINILYQNKWKQITMSLIIIKNCSFGTKKNGCVIVKPNFDASLESCINWLVFQPLACSLLWSHPCATNPPFAKRITSPHSNIVGPVIPLNLLKFWKALRPAGIFLPLLVSLGTKLCQKWLHTFYYLGRHSAMLEI